MAKKTLIFRNSALGENVKVASMTQNLVRRMMNTSENVDFSERINVIDNFSNQVLSSGYSPEQTQKLVVAGLVGYENILKKSTEEMRDLHRSAAGSLESRIKKKLLGRQQWFRDKKKDAGSGKNTFHPSRPKHKKNKDKDSPPETVCVMFVYQTPFGELAKRLQKVENDIAKVSGKRVKIVERSGTMVMRLLHKSNPWAGGNCGRDKCLSCLNGPENQDCFIKNIVYEIKCLDCESTNQSGQSTNQNKIPIYLGESSRSCWERGWEHLSKYQKGILCPMTKHALDKHGGSKKLKFQMKIVKRFFTALARMVGEAVLIARRSEDSNYILLNSKGEYNRCKLPRLTVDEGGGGDERKNAFFDPAFGDDIEKDNGESKVSKRFLKKGILDNDNCAVGQNDFQSSATSFSASTISNSSSGSCGSKQQMNVKKRKR